MTTYFSAIFNVSGSDYTHILYQQKQDLYDILCKLVRTYYFNNSCFICLHMFGLLYLSQMKIHFICCSVYNPHAAPLGSQVNATITVLHNKLLLINCKVDVSALDDWGCFH